MSKKAITYSTLMMLIISGVAVAMIFIGTMSTYKSMACWFGVEWKKPQLSLHVSQLSLTVNITNKTMNYWYCLRDKCQNINCSFIQDKCEDVCKCIPTEIGTTKENKVVYSWWFNDNPCEDENLMKNCLSNCESYCEDFYDDNSLPQPSEEDSEQCFLACDSFDKRFNYSTYEIGIFYPGSSEDATASVQVKEKLKSGEEIPVFSQGVELYPEDYSYAYFTKLISYGPECEDNTLIFKINSSDESVAPFEKEYKVDFCLYPPKKDINFSVTNYLPPKENSEGIVTFAVSGEDVEKYCPDALLYVLLDVYYSAGEIYPISIFTKKVSSKKSDWIDLGNFETSPEKYSNTRRIYFNLTNDLSYDITNETASISVDFSPYNDPSSPYYVDFTNCTYIVVTTADQDDEINEKPLPRYIVNYEMENGKCKNATVYFVVPEEIKAGETRYFYLYFGDGLKSYSAEDYFGKTFDTSKNDELDSVFYYYPRWEPSQTGPKDIPQRTEETSEGIKIYKGKCSISGGTP